MKGVRSVAVALLVATLAACATPQTDLALANPDKLPVKVEVAGVPFFPQEKYYCGPASLAMVLAWSGLPVTQHDIAPQVYTPEREGTFKSDIVAAARRNGRLAVTVPSLRSIMREIAAGNPVLVFQNLALQWYPRWHYAVAFGYDLKAGTLLLRSGLQARHEIDLTVFERTWRRGEYWALAVTPPDRLPVSGSEYSLIAAATGLARAKRHGAAETAFDAIAKKWPGSYVAYMGLGNERYAAKDYKGAGRAFRAAAEKYPVKAAAWNNLANALARQGRRDEAAVAARKAVYLGGANAPTYRETLSEITAGAF